MWPPRWDGWVPRSLPKMVAFLRGRPAGEWVRTNNHCGANSTAACGTSRRCGTSGAAANHRPVRDSGHRPLEKPTRPLHRSRKAEYLKLSRSTRRVNISDKMSHDGHFAARPQWSRVRGHRRAAAAKQGPPLSTRRTESPMSIWKKLFGRGQSGSVVSSSSRPSWGSRLWRGGGCRRQFV